MGYWRRLLQAFHPLPQHRDVSCVGFFQGCNCNGSGSGSEFRDDYLGGLLELQAHRIHMGPIVEGRLQPSECFRGNHQYYEYVARHLGRLPSATHRLAITNSHSEEDRHKRDIRTRTFVSRSARTAYDDQTLKG